MTTLLINTMTLACLLVVLSCGDLAKASAQSPAQRIIRPDDRRRMRNDAQLAKLGIKVYESKRLKLYTDIDPNIAKTLPPLIDQLYLDWEEYLGPLPPDRRGSDFQMSGYLMRDMALFRESGLLPENVRIEHGKHQLNEFWMHDQSFDYYRRHLLIHEATHCFMTFMPTVDAPVWYLEGMAEYFGNHRLNNQMQATFRVMPGAPRESLGFDRITTIRDEIAANKFKPIRAITAFPADEFTTIPHYAWSWALCTFLDRTPRYHARFHKLGGMTEGTQFVRGFKELFAPDDRDLATEWTLFAANLQYGYDLERAAIDFRPGKPLSQSRLEETVDIEADHGWQSSRVLVEKGQRYRITATGRFTLADQPKPWVSEPQGITFRYFEGRPIGQLLGCVRTEEGVAGGETESMLRIILIGAGSEFEAANSGTLYLRLNDAWNSLSDNQGKVHVTVSKSELP